MACIAAFSGEKGGVATKSYTKSYAYDPFGRVASTSTTINGQTYTVSTSYDNVSRVSTITYPTGTVQRKMILRGSAKLWIVPSAIAVVLSSTLMMLWFQLLATVRASALAEEI